MGGTPGDPVCMRSYLLHFGCAWWIIRMFPALPIGHSGICISVQRVPAKGQKNEDRHRTSMDKIDASSENHSEVKTGQATAIAHPNIALVKYWGKRDGELNIPAVGSISVTLSGLHTKTTVQFDPGLPDDQFELNGSPAAASERNRVSRFLDLIRKQAGVNWRARVTSENNFPTAAGLASSASGFAALALAASRAAGLRLSPRELSILARRGSGSAARSVFGGFVEMKTGRNPDGSDAYAEQIAPPDYWPLNVLVTIVSVRKKGTGSTQGMNRSALTSPFYEGWIQSSPKDLQEMRAAICNRDFEKLGEVAEHSCLKMHALMFSSRPPLIYWNKTTFELIEAVREMRNNGVPAYFTIDAGPQVKVICNPQYTEKVKNLLENVDGIQNIIVCALGQNARLIEDTI